MTTLKEKRRRVQDIEEHLALDNVASNLDRARSINVGTAFGGTTEIIMRGNDARYLWCVMQPVEVIELIHQLSANVGCNVELKPRQDFSSWRDWRVSEAEKKHLQSHAPFVNDMAAFQKLGAAGYNDEEAMRIMELLSKADKFVNEDDDTPIVGCEDPQNCALHLMMSNEDGLLHNKLLMEKNEVVYMAGGNGGKSSPSEKTQGVKNGKNIVATEKVANKQTVKRAARAT